MLTGFRARPAAYEHENLDYLTSGFIPTIAVRWLRSFLIAAIAFALPSITIAQSSIPTPLLFSGNTTVVAPPLANTFYGGGPGQFALLARMSDCSMFAVLAEVGHGSPPFTVQLIQADYQDNLHDLAGLTTRADQFSGGCPNPTGGNPAYLLYAYGGRTTSGIQIFVMADMSQPGTIDVYNATLSPMNQQVSMVQTFSVSLPNVQAIAAADLNGDGVQDLVISATSMPSSPGQILVFLGNGDGTFQSTPAFTYNTPSNVSYFSLADLNNDGKLDLVSVLTPTGGSGNANLQVLFGQGNGQFTTGPSTPLTASGSTAYFLPVLLTDLNGDGHLDAVLTDGEVLLGDGTGHFTTGTPLNLSPNGGASWIAAGDFNGDHKVDLAITFDGSSNSVSVVGIFLGNGDGTFNPPTFYSGVPYGFTISTTDVDGDGNLDLVLGENGGGAFLPDPPTLFLAGGLQVLMGKGDGTFAGAAAYPVVTRSQSAFAIADVSGDGHPDIVSPNALLVGDGTGKFTTQSGSQFPGLGSASVTAIRIGDLNGDTIPDAVLATGTPGSGPFVSLGAGGGTFATGTFLSSVPNATDLQIADVNGDNIPDLLVLSNPSGDGTGIQLQVLLGHGDGTFGSPQMVTLPAGVAQSKGGRVYVADVNNDGKPDLVVVDYGAYGSGGQCTAPGGTYVLLGAGNGTFGAPMTITAVSNPFDVAIADLNKDGKVDLVISNTNYGNCGAINFSPAVFLGNGDGTFSSHGTIAVTSHAQALLLGTADFNHDGNLDVAMAGERFSIAFGNGDGTFQPVQATQIAASVTQMQLADLNSDNFPEVVTLSTDAITVMLNEYGSLSLGSPDFTIADNPTMLTVSATGSAMTTVTITPSNGFNGAVSFSCSGLPANSTCSFSPATVTPNGGAVSTTLTISTGVQTATVHHTQAGKAGVLLASGSSKPLGGGRISAHRHKGALFGFIFGGMFLLAVFGAGPKVFGGIDSQRFLRFTASCLMLGLVLFWVACGGSGNNSSSGNGVGGGNQHATPTGTYTVTINATSGSLNHSTTVTLTVN